MSIKSLTFLVTKSPLTNFAVAKIIASGNLIFFELLVL